MGGATEAATKRQRRTCRFTDWRPGYAPWRFRSRWRAAIGELSVGRHGHPNNLMTKNKSPLTRAFKAARQAMGPQRYGTHGKPFVCQLCGQDRFKVGNYIGLLGMHTLICAGCSHVEFFASTPKKIET
jgi:hypothetical protein